MADNSGGAGSGPPAPPPAGQPSMQQLQQYQAAYAANAQYPQAYAAPSYGIPPNNQQADQLKQFWASQMVEVQQVPSDPTVFKNHQLPLARIKKIMKSDEDVRMISAEAPVLFAKACEMFILELTLRSWMHAEENKRRTLQRNDIAAAITKTEIFDFLVDIVPREDKPEEGGAQPAASVPPVAPGAPGMPRPPGPMPPHAPHPLAGPMYYPYPLPPNMTDPSGMMRPPLPMDPALLSMYQQQPFMGMPGAPWPHAMPGMAPPGMPPPQLPVQQQQQQAAAPQAGQQQAAPTALQQQQPLAQQNDAKS